MIDDPAPTFVNEASLGMESEAQHTVSIKEDSLNTSLMQKREKVKARKICTVNGMRTDN